MATPNDAPNMPSMDAAPTNAQGSRCSDLVDPLHHAHAHGVRDREQHHDADEHCDKSEHRPKEVQRLAIIGVDLVIIAHFEIEMPCGEQCLKTPAHDRNILGTMKLEDDTGHFVLAAPVNKLLR